MSFGGGSISSGSSSSSSSSGTLSSSSLSSVGAAGVPSNGMSDDSCPQDGSSKASCLTTTLHSCVLPCQSVVKTIYNLTDNAGSLVPSSGPGRARSIINNICGEQFTNMDACLHCSRNGFGLNADNLHGLLLPWSVTCSTWMDHGPGRAFECLQGYVRNKTEACDSTILLQVANAGQTVMPASKSLLVVGLAMVAYLGLNV